YVRGRQPERRAKQHEPQGPCQGERRHLFAAPGAPGRRRCQKKGHIAAQLRRQRQQVLARQIQLPELVQAKERRCCIGRATTQAGGHRNPLGEADAGAPLAATSSAQQFGGVTDEVFGSGGKVRLVQGEQNLPRDVLREFQRGV